MKKLLRSVEFALFIVQIASLSSNFEIQRSLKYVGVLRMFAGTDTYTNPIGLELFCFDQAKCFDNCQKCQCNDVDTFYSQKHGCGNNDKVFDWITKNGRCINPGVVEDYKFIPVLTEDTLQICHSVIFSGRTNEQCTISQVNKVNPISGQPEFHYTNSFMVDSRNCLKCQGNHAGKCDLQQIYGQLIAIQVECTTYYTKRTKCLLFRVAGKMTIGDQLKSTEKTTIATTTTAAVTTTEERPTSPTLPTIYTLPTIHTLLTIPTQKTTAALTTQEKRTTSEIKTKDEGITVMSTTEMTLRTEKTKPVSIATSSTINSRITTNTSVVKTVLVTAAVDNKTNYAVVGIVAAAVSVAIIFVSFIICALKRRRGKQSITQQSRNVQIEDKKDRDQSEPHYDKVIITSTTPTETPYEYAYTHVAKIFSFKKFDDENKVYCSVEQPVAENPLYYTSPSGYGNNLKVSENVIYQHCEKDDVDVKENNDKADTIYYSNPNVGAQYSSVVQNPYYKAVLLESFSNDHAVMVNPYYSTSDTLDVNEEIENKDVRI